MQITVDLSEKALSAINALALAITSLASNQPVPQALAADNSAGNDSTEDGPVYWMDNTTGYFGKVDDQAAYRAQKKKAPGTVKITPEVYERKRLALIEKNEAAAAEKKAKEAEEAQEAEEAEEVEPEVVKPAKPAKPAKAKPAEAKPAKPAKAAAAPAEMPVEAMMAVVTEFVSPDLDAEARSANLTFVRAILTRFGVTKAREVAAEHRALVANLIERKVAGEDIDPESSIFAEACPHVAADEEEDLV